MSALARLGRRTNARLIAACAAALVWACTSACAPGQRPGHRSTADVAPSDTRLASAIDELRFQVASRPSDMRARSALAHLEMRSGRPGAAFRQLDVMREQGALSAADRTLLARLYAERMDERLAAGDGQAYRDAEQALELGAEVVPELRREAYFLAALVELRRGNQWGRARALAHLASAARLAPDDARLSYRAPEQAALDDLARTLDWLYRGKAMREVLQLSRVYLDRGGRDADALRALVGARAWWGGMDAGDRIDRVLALELATVGVSVCPAATRADAIGCRGTLWSVATGPADVAADVRARADHSSWPRVVDAEATRSFTLLAVRAVTAGESRAVGHMLRERVDLDAVLAAPERLGAALPILLAAAGRFDDAASTLERQLAALHDISEFSPGERVLLVFAAAVQEHVRAPALIDAALAGATDRETESWLIYDLQQIALRHARATGDWQRATTLARAADPSGSERASIIRALVRLALAHLDDPAVGDRLANELVERAVYPGRYAPSVAALYIALGDTGRALAWWQRVVEIQPRHTAHVFELAAAVVAAGDLARARVHFTAAATDSGDAGQALFAAARLLQRTSHALESLYMSKRALALVAPADRRPIIESAIAAMEELGRTAEADELRAHMHGAHHPEQSAALMQATPGDPTDVEAILAWAETEAGRRDPEARRAALVRAAAWNPHDGHAALELFVHAPTDDVHVQYALRRALAAMVDASAPNILPLSPPAAYAREAAHTLRAAWRGRSAGQVSALLRAITPH